MPEETVSKAADAEAKFDTYTDDNGVTYDNYLLIAFEPLNFNDYID